jgi:hypothetical protein
VIDAHTADRQRGRLTTTEGGEHGMAVSALNRGGFALVATTLGVAEAGRRAQARHRAALARSRALCEDLAEHLGWLQHPDDPDRTAEVAAAIRDEASALEVCVGRLAGPCPDAPHLAVEELAALVDAVDAEVRLAVLGHQEARARARGLAAALRAGAATLAPGGA